MFKKHQYMLQKSFESWLYLLVACDFGQIILWTLGFTHL